MNKLEKLLNEYEASKPYIRYTWELQTYKDDHTKKEKQWFNVSIFSTLICHEDAEPLIISKSYKFIDWLVEQNYIQI